MSEHIIRNTSTSFRGCLAVLAMLEERYGCIVLADCKQSVNPLIIEIDIIVDDVVVEHTRRMIQDDLSVGLRAVSKYEDIFVSK